VRGSPAVAPEYGTPDANAAAALGTRNPELGTRTLASPRARRLAAERAVNLAAVLGSGPEGAVLASDVANVAPSPPPPPILGEGPAPGAASLAPLVGERAGVRGEAPQASRLWRTMAERMAASWTSAPHFFLVREVIASALVEMHGRVGPAAERRGGVKPTYTDLLVKLVAAALRREPRMNASWDGAGIRQHAEVNVGIATAVEEGLLVPVIHAADTLTLGEVAARRRDLVDRAQSGRLRPEDVAGGTFTISNLGMYNVDAFHAIVNPPQAGILAVGRLADRVVAIDGQPAVRPTLVLTLSCDHRAIDGARAARFLDELATLVEEPWGLLA